MALRKERADVYSYFPSLVHATLSTCNSGCGPTAVLRLQLRSFRNNRKSLVIHIITGHENRFFTRFKNKLNSQDWRFFFSNPKCIRLFLLIMTSTIFLITKSTRVNLIAYFFLPDHIWMDIHKINAFHTVLL